MSDPMHMKIRAQHRVAGGTLAYCEHDSLATGTRMRFSVFTPPGEGPFPMMIWLSGLTCTEDNFTTKAGAYLAAAESGLMIVAPDTSPRGPDLKGGDVADSSDYDLGQGAGFYVDATQSPWAPHFRMETYVTEDLLNVVRQEFPWNGDMPGLSGHSMGGHGALVLALRCPDLFRSVSAFAPIVNPSTCPWGEKAFSAYLGENRDVWKAHDACELIRSSGPGAYDDILIDQGLADQFLHGQLRPWLFDQACKEAGQKLTFRQHDGYDHSYFFMATFIADHIRWHAARLK
ncbi:MAG: S-formylglutathione hydrolase [Hyphomonadaceae bacterium]